LASLFAVEASIPHQANSFELFGYDVIIDSDLQPKLLEVNTSPSLGTSTPLDLIVKKDLLRDTVSLVNPLRFDRRALREALSRHGGKRHPRRGSLVHGAKGGLGEALQKDLGEVLMGQAVRQFGEMPDHLGRFERIAPSAASEKYHRLTHRGTSTSGVGRPKKSARSVGRSN
jgi:tubulin polyglutamylase TTLL5